VCVCVCVCACVYWCVVDGVGAESKLLREEVKEHLKQCAEQVFHRYALQCCGFCLIVVMCVLIGNCMSLCEVWMREETPS